MTIITGRDLQALLSAKPRALVEHLIDTNIQVGHNGVDLSLRNVYYYTSKGSLGGKQERGLAKCRPIEPEGNGWFRLHQGCYKIDFNEVINIPKNVIGLSLPRSSLLRSGVSIESSVWDSGYCGRGESLMIVHNTYGFDVGKDTSVLQIIFLLCSEEAQTGYSGRYQGII